MIDRAIDRKLVQTALERSRIVALLGLRQSGKTTLAREYLSADSLNCFDLEDPSSLARLDEPDTALRPLKGLVVVNEIQRRPDLFPLLRVLADRRPQPPYSRFHRSYVCSVTPSFRTTSGTAFP
jgi:predicted AAA+ superfamily ATPase